MREVFTMWRHTQMVVLVALSAAIYAAVLIPFKGFVLIPGFTEIRPANVFPFVFGLLFGPAGAWGAAIGNLIGDFFGTLGLGSISGFVGNFFLGLIPYKLWGAFFAGDPAQTIDSRKKLIGFIGIVIAASAACALWIAWFNDLLGNVPFAALGSIITVNNAVAGIVLGPILLLVLYPRVKRWGLLWTEIMHPEEVSPARLRTLGNILMWVGSVGGIVVGLIIALGLYEQGFAAAGFTPEGFGDVGALGIGLGMIPFLALIVIASIMLGGREQVVAEQEGSGRVV
ncbi:QueT transporter family protein [Rubrobacter taiwanensis]|uniref:QueT transporter family protein n=1 Tax=Rubrobacter taiwanensis TaxID=185139 RepID=A0A4R1BEN8_9ACTN|nr:QueT transporter family protein [Rubrobacter taiwanensis]TCJ15636.1 QueT transporter family protein [Rubrobacter taiwanensis]